MPPTRQLGRSVMQAPRKACARVVTTLLNGGTAEQRMRVAISAMPRGDLVPRRRLRCDRRAVDEDVHAWLTAQLGSMQPIDDGARRRGGCR